MDCITKAVELSVLNETSKNFSSDDFKGLLDDESLSIINNSLSTGCLHSIFDTSVVKCLTSISLDEDFTICHLENTLKEHVSQYLDSISEEEKVLRHTIILLVAVANLKVFVEHNWVGPPHKTSLIWPNSSNAIEKSDNLVRPALMIDGEEVSINASNLAHLFVARLLLTQFEEELVAHCKTTKFWLMRCLWIQQFLYSERLPSLKNEITRLIQDVESCDDIFNTENLDAFLQFHLESCHFNYFYYESYKAKRHMERVREASGLSVDLTGALGKRTKFQTSSLPQLVLKVERLEPNRHSDHQNNDMVLLERDPALPKNLDLEDDTVLNSLRLEDPEAVRVPQLTVLEQCIILGTCYHHRRVMEGQGSVIKEETMAYINCVLSQPQNWCVETMALLARCRWEHEGTRYLHRAITQIEELSKQYWRPSEHPINRLSFIFSSILPPHWTIEHELGEMLDNVGLRKSAIEVFQRLQMWDDVIRCHVILSNESAAEALIMQQLSIKETPLLWCFLGDVTKNEEYYHKSWELSGQRFVRAQRSLAFCHVGRKEFDKSLEYFERSLSINPLQVGLWFSYGCACMACHQYDKAVMAFKKTLNLGSDCYEAWTNLATSYIRAKNKPKAFIALQEALKCNFDSWKIWENYLFVSVDIGQFEETIKAYHRLLRLTEKYNDCEVLSVLTRAVCENIKDATGLGSSRLKPKLLELFREIIKNYSVVKDVKVKDVKVKDSDFWRLYAQAISHVEEGQTLDGSTRQKVMEFLKKSHRCCKELSPAWEKEPENCLLVCKRTVLLAEAYTSYLSVLTEDEQKLRTVSSAKLDINGVIVSIKRNKIDFLPGETLDNLNECLQELEGWLEKVLSFKP